MHGHRCVSEECWQSRVCAETFVWRKEKKRTVSFSLPPQPIWPNAYKGFEIAFQHWHCLTNTIHLFICHGTRTLCTKGQTFATHTARDYGLAFRSWHILERRKWLNQRPIRQCREALQGIRGPPHVVRRQGLGTLATQRAGRLLWNYWVSSLPT